MKRLSERKSISFKSTLVHTTNRKGINWLVLFWEFYQFQKNSLLDNVFATCCHIFSAHVDSRANRLWFKQILQSTACKWLIQKIHTMKSMGWFNKYNFLDKLKIPLIWSELFIFDEKVYFKFKGNLELLDNSLAGHLLQLKKLKWIIILCWLTYLLIMTTKILRRCACLTRNPHFKGKLGQMDITLPGQLLHVRKINHHYGLINIVTFYYNWYWIHKDVSGSQENLTFKKSWSKRTFHCLDNYFN